jgi:hypothetical protein
MTRAESDALRTERNRKEYLARQEQKKAYARQHYRKYGRPRKREHQDKPFIPPSTDACESELPYGLRKDKAALRAEYRKIPITERPPYDYFLRCKIVEYIMNYERRE